MNYINFRSNSTNIISRKACESNATRRSDQDASSALNVPSQNQENSLWGFLTLTVFSRNTSLNYAAEIFIVLPLLNRIYDMCFLYSFDEFFSSNKILTFSVQKSLFNCIKYKQQRKVFFFFWEIVNCHSNRKINANL